MNVVNSRAVTKLLNVLVLRSKTVLQTNISPVFIGPCIIAIVDE